MLQWGLRCPKNQPSGLCSWLEYLSDSHVPSWPRVKEIQMEESVTGIFWKWMHNWMEWADSRFAVSCIWGSRGGVSHLVYNASFLISSLFCHGGSLQSISQYKLKHSLFFVLKLKQSVMKINLILSSSLLLDFGKNLRGHNFCKLSNSIYRKCTFSLVRDIWR